MNKQQVIDQIQNQQDLDADFKKTWIDRINTEGLTQEVLDGLREAIQDQIQAHYANAGVTLDENDPAYQAAVHELETELDSAEAEYDATMAQLNKDLDNVQAQAVRDSI